MRVGYGVADITPATPVRLAGFSDRTSDAEGVHDPLFVRVVAIDDLVLVVFDLLAMSQDVSSSIRSSVASATSSSVSMVVTCCSHTHSAPSAISGSEVLGWVPPTGYAEALAESATRAALDARAQQVDCEASFAVAPVPLELCVNRRGNSFEPTMRIMRLRGGSRDVVLVNVGIHAVMLGSVWNEVSSDWVGAYVDECRRRGLGDVVVLPECFGDVNPPAVGASFDEVKVLAAKLADATVAMTLEQVSGTTQVARSIQTTLQCGVTPITALLSLTTVDTESIIWTVAGAPFVFIPGEPFHAVEKRVREVWGARAFVVANAPCWHGYMPDPFGDGYEETLSYGRECVEAMIAAAL